MMTKIVDNIDYSKLQSLDDPDIRLVEEFIDFLKQRRSKQEDIPVSIFSNDKLTVLEAVVKYLREELSFSYSRIASIIKRKEGPVGVTYRKAKSKMPEKLDTSSREGIPLGIFSRRLSCFESVVLYLDKKGMETKEIAWLLRRNYRTIWTINKRARRKNKDE